MARIKLKYVNAFANYRRRNERVRYYFRRRGFKAIPLPGLPGSEAFMEAYQMALAAIPDTDRPEIGARRTELGTINALVVSYYNSGDWTNLADDTRSSRRRIIEKFRIKHGSKRVRLLSPEHIVKMLGEITRPTAKRSWLKAIRGLLKHAVPTMRKDDPTEGIASIKLPETKPHHTWSDAEVAQYRAYWRLGTQQRLVMEFALETASRRGEVVRLGPQHVYTGSEGEPRIHIQRTHRSKDVDIPISPELKAACDAMPKQHLTYIVTAYGKPRSKYGLGNDFAGWARAAGLPDHCRLHGLKKGGMRRRAEAGNTAHELMAFSGHKTLAEVQRYTEDANYKRLADSGAAKMQAVQNKNATYTNIEALLHKHEPKPLKAKRWTNEMALPRGLEPLFSP
jgi:integrase